MSYAPAAVVCVTVLVMFCLYIGSVFYRAWNQRHQPDQDPFPETQYGYEECFRRPTDPRSNAMKLSNFADYFGAHDGPRAMKIATVSVTVPFLFIFTRTIHKVPIVRPAGSIFWQFLNGEQEFLLFEEVEFDMFGRKVQRTPGEQAENLERAYLEDRYERAAAKARLVRSTP